MDSCAQWILAKESTILEEARSQCGYAGITQLNLFGPPASLRTRVLRHGDRDFPFQDPDATARRHVYTQPTNVKSRIFRRAVELGTKDKWYELYLLSWIEEPNAGDRARLRSIWENAGRNGEAGKRLVAVDVLFSWKDTATLLRWLPECTTLDERYEAAWALAALRVPEAARDVEIVVRERWHEVLKGATGWLTGSDAGYDGRIDRLLEHGKSTGRASAFWSYLIAQRDPESVDGRTLAHTLATDPELEVTDDNHFSC